MSGIGLVYLDLRHPSFPEKQTTLATVPDHYVFESIYAHVAKQRVYRELGLREEDDRVAEYIESPYNGIGSALSIDA